MPEPIRLRPLSGQQMAVYEEFTRTVPGFAATETTPLAAAAPADAAASPLRTGERQ